MIQFDDFLITEEEKMSMIGTVIKPSPCSLCSFLDYITGNYDLYPDFIVLSFVSFLLRYLQEMSHPRRGCSKLFRKKKRDPSRHGSSSVRIGSVPIASSLAVGAISRRNKTSLNLILCHFLVPREERGRVISRSSSSIRSSCLFVKFFRPS